MIKHICVLGGEGQLGVGVGQMPITGQIKLKRHLVPRGASVLVFCFHPAWSETQNSVIQGLQACKT